jgi:tryptophan synthase beta chain
MLHADRPLLLFMLLQKLCPTLADGTKVVVNLSGRGDKDVNTVIKALGMLS